MEHSPLHAAKIAPRREPLVSSWLQERQSLILALNTLCSHRPYQKENQFEITQALLFFSQQLMDYVSFIHFEILEKVEGAVLDSSLSERQLPKSLLRALTQSSLQALDFNDQHTKLVFNNIEAFDRALSEVAEALAERFDLEDVLIRLYQKALRLRPSPGLSTGHPLPQRGEGIVRYAHTKI